MTAGLRRLLCRSVATLIFAATCGPMALAQAPVHPLCGAVTSGMTAVDGVCGIIDARSGTPKLVDGDAAEWLAAAAQDADIVVLGEVHDNPLHHRLRGTVVERSAKARDLAGRPKPAIVFEHIRADQRAALGRFVELQRDAEGRGSADDLLGFLDWDASGWPDKSMFRPLFQSLLGARLTILPGDAPRDEIRKIARGGASALGAEERARLKLSDPLPPPLADALTAELKDSHCGLMPEAAIAPMSVAQRYRDAHLADAAVTAARTHGASVLLAGNGHVRADRGAPYYIRLKAPSRTLLTAMLLEVEAGRTDALAYLPRDPGGVAAVDVVILTTRAEREDPCEALRRRMARPKAGEKPAEGPPRAGDKPAETRPVP